MEIEFTIENDSNNIAKILTGYDGQGLILYSPLYGYMELIEVQTGASYPIKCKAFYNYHIYQFSWNGKVDFADSECMLFPSKEQRDWSKFKPCNKFTNKKSQLKPFDKVLVRDSDNCEWSCDFFCKEEDNIYYCMTSYWNQCVPYEGNEYLLDTTDNPKE